MKIGIKDGQLAKAKIVNLDTKVEVLCSFNPKEYSLSRSNSWSEGSPKGKNLPELEFGGGAPASLTLQLLFDTYANPDIHDKDVSKLTKPLWEMMKISDTRKNPKTGLSEPPHCQFQWGNLRSFEAVIVSISEKFTLFAPNGTPLRAIVDVTFKQVAEQDKFPGQNPTSGGHPGEHLRAVREGETLPYIAFEEYGDSTVWRHLADTNQIADPRRLRPGQLLLITPLPLS